MHIVCASTLTLLPSLAITALRSTMLSACRPASAGSRISASSNLRERNVPSASYRRSANASAATANPADRNTSSIGDPAIMHRLVVKRPMGLDVPQSCATTIGNFGEHAHLFENGSRNLLCQQLQLQPAEIRAVLIAGMSSNRQLPAKRLLDSSHHRE